jgi:hypothetical protein
MDKFRVGTWLVLIEHRFEARGERTLPCLVPFVQVPLSRGPQTQ